MPYSIKQILQENWRKYLKNHKTTSYQRKEIEKTINCSKQSCNSRICTSCGKRYTDHWSDKLRNHLFPVGHKHIVLTAPATLGSTLRDWNNLKVLMDSSQTFLRSILDLSIIKNRILG